MGSLDVVKAGAEVLESGERTLTELADAANREHECVLLAGRKMLEHAIRAGAVLHEVRERIGVNGWKEWVEQNLSVTVVPANTYIRVWRYQENLPIDESLSLVEAVKHLRGLPPVTGKDWQVSPETMAKRELARKLRDEEGLSYPKIAARVGVDSARVWRWLNPKAVRQQRADEYKRRKRATRALQAEESKQIAQRVGGATAESYSLVRKTAQVLDRAIEEASGRESRAALRAALAQVHQAEDEIVRALGFS